MNDSRNNFKNIELFWNVQFIYELVLAQLELQSFDVEYKVSEDFRNFSVKEITNLEQFLSRTAYFGSALSRSSLYNDITSKNITRSINQYLTHWFYPYKGKFHPQMIRALINYMKVKEGETILDPFVGSGTAALEAQLLGINCIGVDVSEVCSLISQVKTNSIYYIDDIIYNQIEIEEELGKLQGHQEEEISTKISQITSSIEKPEVRNFFKVSELIAHSDKIRRRKKDFRKSFLKNSAKMITSVSDYADLQKNHKLKLGKVDIYKGDSRELKLNSNSIDGIVSSPPYSIALDYVENDKHALSALGHDIEIIRNDFIGVRGKGKNKISSYNKDMEKIYLEMDRVLKKDKYCVIIIGNARINKEEIKTVEMTINQFQNMGYKLERNIDKIIFGLYNIMQKENILIFKKER
jgi:tRNA G10  N-methylase Trm11